jgi:hypothetical protein
LGNSVASSDQCCGPVIYSIAEEAALSGFVASSGPHRSSTTRFAVPELTSIAVVVAVDVDGVDKETLSPAPMTSAAPRRELHPGASLTSSERVDAASSRMRSSSANAASTLAWAAFIDVMRERIRKSSGEPWIMLR